MADLRHYARLLGGDVTGKGILMPGPGHSRSDRSLFVTFEGDEFTVHSFADDDWRECKDHVRSMLGGAAYVAPAPTATDQDNRDYAQRIWNEARSANGTSVETYLTGRGLEIVPEVSGLRFHPSCPFKGERVAAMLAAIVSVKTNVFQGVHRTRLNPKDKAMLGPARGGVVKLTADDDVSGGLHICEGIETGLALLSMGFRPMWACLSAGGIAAFPVLPGVEALTIFADNDASGTGQQAAQNCAGSWMAAGCEVRVLVPAVSGSDFADRGAA